MAQPAHLRILASAIGGRVTRCHHINANVGEVQRREARGKLGKYRIRVGEAVSRFSFEISGFETSLAFAVGARDKVCLMDRRLKLGSLYQRLAVFIDEESPQREIRNWLRQLRNVKALRALDCSRREPLQVYRNGVVLVVDSGRATSDLFPLLVDFANRLPRARRNNRLSRSTIDGLTFDPESIPKDLQKLARHVRKWAVGDDVERGERLAAAKPTEFAKLLKEVGPALRRIDEYLDSFEEPLPDEAILVGRLAEAVAELRATGFRPVKTH